MDGFACLRHDKVLDEQVGQQVIEDVGQHSLVVSVRKRGVQELEGSLLFNRQPISDLLDGFTRVRRDKVLDEQVGQQVVEGVGQHALVVSVRECGYQKLE